MNIGLNQSGLKVITSKWLKDYVQFILIESANQWILKT